MSFKRRDPSLYLVDIFLASYLIEHYAHGFKKRDELLYHRLHCDGVIREFEIIAEATNKLLKSGWLKESEDFRQIVDFRNRIVHEYFGIDEEIVFDAVKSALPEFIMRLKNILKEKKYDLTAAIDTALLENDRNEDIVAFLESLKDEFKNL